MNAILDLLRVRGKKAFSTLAGVGFAGTLAWFVVPCIFGLFAANIPSLWTFVRSSTAPPYLFIAVNFIIFAIWKLSEKGENRALQADCLLEEESPFKPDVVSLRSQDLVASHNPHLERKISPEEFGKTPFISAGNAISLDSEPSPAPASESSCITTGSEVKSSASSSSNNLLVSEGALTAICSEGKDEKVVDERNETDSLDAAWNAISRKGDRWEISPPSPLKVSKLPVRVLAKEIRGNNALPEGNDEINQRFDDFIKKNYDQIRLRKPG